MDITESMVGRRVGVVSHVDEEKSVAYLYGFGVYVGFFRPSARPNIHPPVGYFAAMRSTDCYDALLRLDDGNYVWGCECWWGGEDSVKKRLQQYQKVEKLDIVQERKKAARVSFNTWRKNRE